ncbi:MAG TPA: hypothetical protein VI142_02455 [Gaiellaceae bacterium]
MQAVRAIYRWWLALMVVAIVVQIGAAGYGAFYAADKADPGPMTHHQFDHGFSFHGGFGTIIILAGFVALILALIAMPKRTKLMTLVLAVLLVLQQVFASVGESTPAVGVLHPINAFLILGLTGRLAVEAWWGSRRPAAAAT